MNRVGIVIPFYKNKEQLDKCEKALSIQSHNQFEVFIHDNSDKNIGFTKAVNIGLRKFKDLDYTIILNQDCYLKKDAIKNMVAFMDSHKKCAIGGIKQLSSKNNDMILHGGCTEAFPNGKHLGGSVEQGHCSTNKKMPWINGACMIVNNDLMLEFGLMNENYFLIGSDSDWCYSARLRGLEVWYIADAECIHEEDGISRKNKDKSKQNLMKLDMVHFRDKWILDECFREMALEVFVD